MRNDSTTSDDSSQPDVSPLPPNVIGGAWLRMDADLEEHPKFHALLARRRWSADRGLAFYYRFLRAVRCHAPLDGDVTDWTDAILGRMTRVSRPDGLVADLVACGIVDEVGGRRTVHHWMERNGAWVSKYLKREAKAAGGRKGGATRAATGERDAAGRYRPSVDGRWPDSGTRLPHAYQSKQEQEQQQQQEPKAPAASSSLRSEDLARSARPNPVPAGNPETDVPHPADTAEGRAAREACMAKLGELLNKVPGA